MHRPALLLAALFVSALPVAAASPGDVFTDDAGTLARFEFNGDIFDNSPNGRDPTRVGADPASFALTPFGSGLVLSSPDDGLVWDAYKATLTHPFSLEWVFYADDVDGWQKLFSHDDDSDSGIYVFVGGVQDYPHAALGQGVMQDGLVGYIAVVSESSTQFRAFVNGVDVGLSEFSHDYAATPTHARFLYDDTVTDRGEQFLGAMEAMRVSSVARTPEEIQATCDRIGCEGQAPPLPELSSFGLVAAGIAGLAFVALRRR